MVTRKNNPDADNKNFTMLFDNFPKELKGKYAWVYAAINRHCMMRERVCRASQGTLAKESRVSLSRLKVAQKWLIQNDFIIDLTPNKEKSAHTLKINDWKIDSNQDNSYQDDDPWNDDDE